MCCWPCCCGGDGDKVSGAGPCRCCCCSSDLSSYSGFDLYFLSASDGSTLSEFSDLAVDLVLETGYGY